MSVKQIFNTSAELDYPKVLPTLDLDFANSKTLDPRITFTRASGGSYVGADGLIKLAGVNEPRFDHDPYTGESLGFLVEEARTNLCPYSEDIANAGWTKINLSVTKETINGPGGLIPYDKLTLGTFTNTYAAAAIPFNLTSSTLYSTSIYLKAGTCRYAILTLFSNNSVKFGAYFDLQTGTMANNRGSQAYTISSVGNGWYKVSIVTDSLTGGGGYWGTWILPSPTNSNESRDYLELTAGFDTYNAAGEYLYAFASQCEAGAFPTSYIPTEGSSRTRAADVPSITGKNFSSWYNKNQGTVLCDYRTLQSYGWAVVWQLLTGGNQGFLGLQYGDYFASFSRQGGGLLPLLGASFTNNLNKTIISYSSVSSTSVSSTSVTINGAAPVSGSQIVLDTIDSLSFYGPPDPHLTKTISRLTYYPKRLTNQQLQVLTT